jgi:hypothetical protein
MKTRAGALLLALACLILLSAASCEKATSETVYYKGKAEKRSRTHREIGINIYVKQKAEALTSAFLIGDP